MDLSELAARYGIDEDTLRRILVDLRVDVGGDDCRYTGASVALGGVAIPVATTISDSFGAYKSPHGFGD